MEILTAFFLPMILVAWCGRLASWRHRSRVFLASFFLPMILAACSAIGDGSPRVPVLPTPVPTPDFASLVQTIQLPPGFSISIFAQGLDDPRMLAIGPDGQAYVAERGGGRILRLPDEDQDGKADRIQVVAVGFKAPSSLAFFQDGSLYVAETTQILRLSNPDLQGVFQERTTVIDSLPDGGHVTRTIAFSPDWEKLFVSIGSSCNVCMESDRRRAAIMVYNPDGSAAMVYARGLRNAVGLAFRPEDGQLWATNNGRDLLGDDLPPDTIQAVHQGLDYGWPRCHAGWIIDPQFGGPGGCKDVMPAAVQFQAHSAPLGLTFYSGTQFPSEYQGSLFVAFHGSWNRTPPTGYKIVRLAFKDGKLAPAQDFAVGWLNGKSAWGRPVDVITASDGSILVSDDQSGIIYRISYTGKE